MLIKLSLIYNFKYFILAVYLRFGISSLFSDCWIFLVRFSYKHFRHTQIFSLSNVVLLMPTMLLKHFQIKWKLIHVRLQIAVSIISLLSYCGNWSVSEELSNTKRNARNFVQSVKTSLMSYLCWLAHCLSHPVAVTAAHQALKRQMGHLSSASLWDWGRSCCWHSSAGWKQ